MWRFLHVKHVPIYTANHISLSKLNVRTNNFDEINAIRKKIYRIHVNAKCTTSMQSAPCLSNHNQFNLLHDDVDSVFFSDKDEDFVMEKVKHEPLAMKTASFNIACRTCREWPLHYWFHNTFQIDSDIAITYRTTVNT